MLRRQPSDVGSSRGTAGGTAVHQLKHSFRAAAYGGVGAKQSPQVLFKKLDSDSSGYLTRTQWIQGVKKCGKSRMADHEAAALFERLDTDNDQRISYEELLAFVWDGVDPRDESDDDVVDDSSPQYDYSRARRDSVSSRRSGRDRSSQVDRRSSIADSDPYSDDLVVDDSSPQYDHSRARRDSVSSRRSGRNRSPRPRPELDRRSSIADSDIATRDYAAAVRDWDDDYGGADRASLQNFDAEGGAALSYDNHDSASGWATSPVYQDNNARSYDRRERHRHDARYRSGVRTSRRGGRSALVDSDNQTSSASDVERGSGSETESEGSPLRWRGREDSSVHHRTRAEWHRRDSSVSRAEATRHSSSSTYRRRGAAYSGFRDDDEETRYTDNTLSAVDSRSGSGNDEGAAALVAAVDTIRKPHWTEKSNHKHDRHLMARASEHHEDLWQAIVDIKGHGHSELSCSAGDAIVVTEQGGSGLWKGYLLHKPDQRGEFLPDWVKPMYAVHDGFTTEAQEASRIRQQALDAVGGDDTETDDDIDRSSDGAGGFGGYHASARANTDSDTADDSDHDTVDEVDLGIGGLSDGRSRRLSPGGVLHVSTHESKAAHRVRELLSLPAGDRGPLERALIDADVEGWTLDRHGQAEVLERLAEEFSYTDPKMEGHVCAAAERLRLLSLNATSMYSIRGGCKYVDAFALFEDNTLDAICEVGSSNSLPQESNRGGVRLIIPPWVVREYRDHLERSLGVPRGTPTVLKIVVRRFTGHDHEDRQNANTEHPRGMVLHASPWADWRLAQEQERTLPERYSGRRHSRDDHQHRYDSANLRVASPVVEVTAHSSDGSPRGFQFRAQDNRPRLMLPHSAGEDWKRLRLHIVSRDHHDVTVNDLYLRDEDVAQSPIIDDSRYLGNENFAWFELPSFGVMCATHRPEMVSINPDATVDQLGRELGSWDWRLQFDSVYLVLDAPTFEMGREHLVYQNEPLPCLVMRAGGGSAMIRARLVASPEVDAVGGVQVLGPLRLPRNCPHLEYEITNDNFFPPQSNEHEQPAVRLVHNSSRQAWDPANPPVFELCFEMNHPHDTIGGAQNSRLQPGHCGAAWFGLCLHRSPDLTVTADQEVGEKNRAIGEPLGNKDCRLFPLGYIVAGHGSGHAALVSTNSGSSIQNRSEVRKATQSILSTQHRGGLKDWYSQLASLASAFPAELPRPRPLQGIHRKPRLNTVLGCLVCTSRPAPARKGAIQAGPAASGLRVAMADDTVVTRRRRVMRTEVRNHREHFLVDEVEEMRRLYRLANKAFDGEYPATKDSETNEITGVGWLGFSELIGWMYPTKTWTEVELHHTFVNAGLLPAAGLGDLHPKTGGGSTVENMKAYCADLSEDTFVACMESLHHHDWQEAIFALYSSDGRHLNLRDFARLIQKEYDHGIGRNQLPQANWANSGEGLRRWAGFCQHFGASPENGLDRSEFVRFDIARRGHTSDERWRKSHRLKALANIQPGEEWRAQHRKKFEIRTRSSVETKLLQRRGAELLVEPHRPPPTITTAADETGPASSARSAVAAGLATSDGVVDEPLFPPVAPLVVDGADANAVADDNDDETPSLFPPMKRQPATGSDGPGGATGEHTGAGSGNERAAVAAAELPNEARYPAFCRAVDPVTPIILPDLESVLQRVEEDGHLPLIPTDQLDFTSPFGAGDDSNDQLLLAAFSATPTGPMYHARRYASGGQQQVSVLVLREPPILAADGRLISSAEQQAHESAAARQRAAFYDDLRFLGRRWQDHPNLARTYGVADPRGAGLHASGMWWAEQRALLIMEPLALGSLGRLITCASTGASGSLHGRPPVELPWKLRVRLATGVASALKYLYGLDIPHAPQELHSHSVFVTSEYVPKLCGSIRRVDDAKQCHSEKTNVFHFGTVLWELLTRRSAVDGLLGAYKQAEAHARRTYRWPTGEDYLGSTAAAAAEASSTAVADGSWLVIRDRTLRVGHNRDSAKVTAPPGGFTRADLGTLKQQLWDMQRQQEENRDGLTSQDDHSRGSDGDDNGFLAQEQQGNPIKIRAGSVVRELKAEKCPVKDRRLHVVLVYDHKGRRADVSGRKGTVPPVQGWISTTRSDHHVAVKPYTTTVTKCHIFNAVVPLFRSVQLFDIRLRHVFASCVCAQVHSSLWVEALGCVEAAQREAAVVSSPHLAHQRHQREVEHNRGSYGSASASTARLSDGKRLALDEAEGVHSYMFTSTSVGGGAGTPASTVDVHQSMSVTMAVYDEILCLAAATALESQVQRQRNPPLRPLPMPHYRDCPIQFCNLLEQCWASQPSARPSFSKILDLLQVRFPPTATYRPQFWV
jgi:hypothetical protein